MPLAIHRQIYHLMLKNHRSHYFVIKDAYEVSNTEKASFISSGSVIVPEYDKLNNKIGSLSVSSCIFPINC